MVAKRVRDALPLKLSTHWEVNIKSEDVLREISLNTGSSLYPEDAVLISAEESRLSIDVEETIFNVSMLMFPNEIGFLR